MYRFLLAALMLLALVSCGDNTQRPVIWEHAPMFSGAETVPVTVNSAGPSLAIAYCDTCGLPDGYSQNRYGAVVCVGDSLHYFAPGDPDSLYVELYCTVQAPGSSFTIRASLQQSLPWAYSVEQIIYMDEDGVYRGAIPLDIILDGSEPNGTPIYWGPYLMFEATPYAICGGASGIISGAQWMDWSKVGGMVMSELIVAPPPPPPPHGPKDPQIED